MANFKKTNAVFYIVHGEDEFKRKGWLKEFRASLNDPSGINTSEYNGANISAQALLNNVSAIPFLADNRVAIVEGMLGLMGKRGAISKEELEVLVQGLPYLPDFARLIFLEESELSDKHAIMKLAQDPNGRGEIVYFPGFKKAADAVPWITKYAKEVYHVTIEPTAAHALASVVDKDMRVADSELAKLAAYVNGERPITERDVALMTAYVATADIFAMVDAMGQRDGKTAVTITQRLLEEGQEPLSIFGMIIRQYRLLILTKEHFEKRGASKELAKAIGVHSFVAEKLESQARNFANIAQLEDIYRSLDDFDFKIKTGRLSDELALQLFIASVTG